MNIEVKKAKDFKVTIKKKRDGSLTLLIPSQGFSYLDGIKIGETVELSPNSLLGGIFSRFLKK